MPAFGQSTIMSALSIAPNLLAAVIFGMFIGVERQWRQRTTGLTTHALVALGSAAFTSLAVLTGGPLDLRLGGQVVTGIGFLGAGLIMRDGLSVKGLSGAATVWSTGAVGVLAGYGYFLEAAEATGFVIFINVALPRIGGWIEKYAPENKMVERFYVIELKCAGHDEADVRSMLLNAMNARSLRLQGLESQELGDSGRVEVEATFYSARQEDKLVELVVGELSLSRLVFSAKWTSTTPAG